MKPLHALLRQPDNPLNLAVLSAVGLCVLGVTILASLAVGARDIPIDIVLSSLAGHDTGPDGVIVLNARLPRTLAGLVGGAALGVSGALIQAITRNPLSEPGILGINAGAGLAIALVIMLAGSVGTPWLFAAGFGGALGTAILVLLVGDAGGGRSDPAHFILAGVALGAVMGGVSSALALLNPATFDRMRFWMAGTLDIGDLGLALAVVPVVMVGTIAALLLARPLNALALGHDVAASLGARPVLVQTAGLGLIALLCGVTTAMTGPIAFVGLMIPHVARRLAGQNMVPVLVLCMILAPILLLVSDIVGRVIVVGELRVSIVTAFLGAPVLIAMARRHAAG